MAAIATVTAIYPVQRKMIDIHTHVVYGVDDGARSLEMSMQMLRNAVEGGITGICCTAHARPGHRLFPAQDYLERLELLQRFLWQEGLDLCLYSGCEIMYTSEAIQALRGGFLPTLGGKGAVLTEFMPEIPWGMMQHAVREMSNAGFHVLVAHVERYECLREAFTWLEELKEMGCFLQMNAETVLRSHGLMGDRWARKALKTGLIDVVASDMHNLTSRKGNLPEARAMLKRDYGEETALRLTEDTPRRILEGSLWEERRKGRSANGW